MHQAFYSIILPDKKYQSSPTALNVNNTQEGKRLIIGGMFLSIPGRPSRQSYTYLENMSMI